MTQKAQTIKETADKYDHIKIKTFRYQKNTISKGKNTAQSKRRYLQFKMHKINKRLVSRI